MKPYEIVEHTADVGLRIYGKTVEELFVNAARGFFDLLVDVQSVKDSAGGRPQRPISFHVEAEDSDFLLLKWLRELLYLFSTKQVVLDNYQCELLTKTELRFQTSAYLFDPQIHELKTEIKAVTYHDYKFETNQDGWMAQVIFDI